MQFKVISDRIESYTSKGQTHSTRRLLLLGAGNDLAEQLCEFNLPPESAPVGAGIQVEIHVSEISSIFSGKPRLRGQIVSTAPGAVIGKPAATVPAKL